MLPSSRGQDSGFSFQQQGFKSPWKYQFAVRGVKGLHALYQYIMRLAGLRMRVSKGMYIDRLSNRLNFQSRVRVVVTRQSHKLHRWIRFPHPQPFLNDGSLHGSIAPTRTLRLTVANYTAYTRCKAMSFKAFAGFV